MSARNDVPRYDEASRVKTSQEEKEKSENLNSKNYIGNLKQYWWRNDTLILTHKDTTMIMQGILL